MHASNWADPGFGSIIRLALPSLPMRQLHHGPKALALATALMCSSMGATASPEGNDPVNVKVQCTRASSLIQIEVASHRKIGAVSLEVKDRKGVTLYREEGKALTPELVRRLDKGVFPKGTHTLTVVARDFARTEAFTIE